ncbi:hypothetical protein [Actinomadura gamaensis]|uniref:Uncharacterized protein n=1 Tax=Actinomadura gamaensis TaxID=1763541 RepID=A0ABV9TQY3_9ACTN
MTIPPPDLLWAHGAVRAALGRGFSLDAEGVASEDIGNGWWRLFWGEGGRAVLLGFDNDYSDTAVGGPPLDLLADAPDWLPWERVTTHLHRDWPVGFVYWWDGSSWGRTSYTCEDGAESTLPTDDGELAEQAGLAGGSVRPEVPAGRGEPPGRKVPWDGLPEVHATIVGSAMKRAEERSRPVRPPSEALSAVVEFLRANGQDEILAGYIGDQHLPYREPQGPFVKGELGTLLDALRAHEADPESGRWLYVRVTADGRVSRAYDTLPDWWHPSTEHTWAWPDMLKLELASRAEPWRPDWEWLLDAAALGDGVPPDLCAKTRS